MRVNGQGKTLEAALEKLAETVVKQQDELSRRQEQRMSAAHKVLREHKAAAQAKEECGPVVLADDQTVFHCQGCGESVNRTRNDPYPEVKHRKKKPDPSV